MFKGAIILSAGFVAGYALAVSHNEEVRLTVRDFRVKVKEVWDEAGERESKLAQPVETPPTSPRPTNDLSDADVIN